MTGGSPCQRVLLAVALHSRRFYLERALTLSDELFRIGRFAGHRQSRCGMLQRARCRGSVADAGLIQTPVLAAGG